MMWQFASALIMVRRLEAALDPVGFHVGITGSVLTRGGSVNDLDLIVFPHSTGHVNMAEVRNALGEAGLQPAYSRAAVASAWERRGSFDTKHVERWKFITDNDTKYIDLFFLS